MKTFLSSLLLFLYMVTTIAQTPDDFRAKYNREVITLLTTQQFIVGEKVVSRKAIRDLLLKYPESAAEYKLFQKKQKIANVLTWTGLGLCIASFPLLNVNEGAAFGTFIGASAAVFGSIPFSFKAHRHLLRAVYLYNREVLANPQ